MKIGINGYETVISRVGYDAKTRLPIRVGSGQYAYELLQAFYKIDTKNEYIIYLPCPKIADLPKERENWHYVTARPQKAWTIFGLSVSLLFNQPSVFFSATHYAPIVSRCPLVISIMDLSYLKFPELFKKRDLWQLRLWTKLSIQKAKKVLTISQASKNDIIKEYGVEDNKVVVTYPGIKNVYGIRPTVYSKNMNKVLEKYQITGPYILFVGTIQPRKNIVRLIEAFSQPTKVKNLQLVIIGRPGWMYEEILVAPKKFGVENKVKFLTEITSEELPDFYKNAACFVLPSLYEGFGLPILEAMQNGCPVITSNVSSMPEAGGDAALYVNPENVEDIKEKIELVIGDEKLRNEMIKKGFVQVKKFSWEKTARETLKVLEEVTKTK